MNYLDKAKKKLKKLTTKKYNENDVSLKDVLDICKQRYEKYQFRLNNLKYELKSINKEFKFHEYNPKNITLTFSKKNNIYTVTLKNEELIILNEKHNLSLYEIDSLKFLLLSLKKYSDKLTKIDVGDNNHLYLFLKNSYIVTKLNDNEILVFKKSNECDEYKIYIENIKTKSREEVKKDKTNKNYELRSLAEDIKIDKNKLPIFIKSKIKKGNTRKRKIIKS